MMDDMKNPAFSREERFQLMWVWANEERAFIGEEWSDTRSINSWE